ncbi:MAG: DUF3850 domain-containing protein [Ferruginibacter sp.]|nr:DUF3850 domain-containing protein [Ferruginibacter sp.]
MIHELKTDPSPFDALIQGKKNFEIRYNDRDFKVGDELLLKEFLQQGHGDIRFHGAVYTGRILHRKIDYILTGGMYGIEEGFVILSLSKM